MPEYTEEQIEEMKQQAVEKTERSFGGTFKRLKSENEELRERYDTAVAEHETSARELEHRIGELETLLTDSTRQISELTVRGEIQRQLKDSGPLPARFIDMEAIDFSTDPEVLRENVAGAIERGRTEFGKVLTDMGISTEKGLRLSANPTNPPARDTKTARDMKRSDAQSVLRDMSSRGLLR